MEKTPVEMIGILPEEAFLLAKEFIELGEKLDCKSKVRFAPAHKTWKCVFQRKKPSRVLFTLECTEKRWHIKACLWNIDAYRDLLSECSEKINSVIVNAYDCKTCNGHCAGSAVFTLNDVKYNKCVGSCFYFSKMCSDDWRSLLTLIRKEHEASNLVT